ARAVAGRVAPAGRRRLAKALEAREPGVATTRGEAWAVGRALDALRVDAADVAALEPLQAHAVVARTARLAGRALATGVGARRWPLPETGAEHRRKSKRRSKEDRTRTKGHGPRGYQVRRAGRRPRACRALPPSRKLARVAKRMHPSAITRMRALMRAAVACWRMR